MNVLHICTADNYGGAAKAAYRLIQGLRRNHIVSTMLVREKWEKHDAAVAVRRLYPLRFDCQDLRIFKYSTQGPVSSLNCLAMTLEIWDIWSRSCTAQVDIN